MSRRKNKNASRGKSMIYPEVVKKKLGILINNVQEIDEIYNKLSYLLCPKASNSVWSKSEETRKIIRSNAYVLDRHFIKAEKDSLNSVDCSNDEDEPPRKLESPNSKERIDHHEGQSDFSHSRSLDKITASTSIVEESVPTSDSSRVECTRTNESDQCDSSICSIDSRKHKKTKRSVDYGKSKLKERCRRRKSSGVPYLVKKKISDTMEMDQESTFINTESLRNLNSSVSVSNGSTDLTPKAERRGSKKIIDRLTLSIKKSLSKSADSKKTHENTPEGNVCNELNNFSLHSEGDLSQTQLNNSTVKESLNSLEGNKIDCKDPEISPSKDLLCLDGNKEANFSCSQEDSSLHAQKKSTKKRECARKIEFGQSHQAFNIGSKTEKISKLVHIRDINKDVDMDTLYPNDINPEDDLYLVQCPQEIDINDLTGMDLSLLGASSLSLRNSDKVVKYDCLTVKSDSSLNLLLPSRDRLGVQFGLYPCSGKIILSKTVDVLGVQGVTRHCPETDGGPSRPPEEAPHYSQSLQGEHFQDQLSRDEHTVDDEYLTSFTEFSEHSVIKKRKKKKNHKGDVHTIDDECLTSFTDSSEHPVNKERKKKKKHKGDVHTIDDECLTSFTDSSEHPVTKERKKKKKHKGDKHSVDEECLASFTESCEHPVNKKRKKKKKHKGDVHTVDEECLTSFTESSEHPVNKERKKKKKHKGDKHTVDEECLTSFTESSEHPVNKKRKKKKKHKESYPLFEPHFSGLETK